MPKGTKLLPLISFVSIRDIVRLGIGAPSFDSGVDLLRDLPLPRRRSVRVKKGSQSQVHGCTTTMNLVNFISRTLHQEVFGILRLFAEATVFILCSLDRAEKFIQREGPAPRLMPQRHQFP